LAGLLGGIWGALALNNGQGGVIALALAFGAFTAAIAVFRYREMVRNNTHGATTLIAAMLAFALGALAVVGNQKAAAAAGVATALLLALKAVSHEWVKRLTWEELRAGLILLAMTVILLPLLPDRELAPWLPVNPHAIWLLTIPIAALSSAGYVAIRLAGPSVGVLLSGLAGGLVSSTAVTLNMARLARPDGERCHIFAAGVLIASAVMMLRMLVIVGVVNVALLPPIAAPLLLGAVALAAIAGYLASWGHEDRPVGKPLTLHNPFELRVVLEFGALLALIMAAAKLLSAWAGPNGALALAAISGFVDVDAISISLAELAPQGLSPGSAVWAILVAVLANSLAKVGLATTVGGLKFGQAVGPGIAASLAAAALGLLPALLT
jgi:uncharacterized membrane protein (DUF4010 family)